MPPLVESEVEVDEVKNSRIMVPDEWGCKRADAKVGFFAVLEVVYGEDGDEKGISVAQV
jgi:hypothetical protein